MSFKANLSNGSVCSNVLVQQIGEPIGKGLFALKNFEEGDIIFEEDPVVSCQFLWNADYGYSACDHCMRPLETAGENARRLVQNNELDLPHQESGLFKKSIVKCPQCHSSYCCESCRDKAWNQYHRVLCLNSLTKDPNHPLVALQEVWKSVHYPPESACVMLLARILATIRQAENEDDANDIFLNFCHRATNEEDEIAHKLLGKEFQQQLDKLRVLMEKALGGSDVQRWLTPEGFRSLIALVGTNGQGIGTSALSQWVRTCEQLESIDPDQRETLDTFIDNLYEKLDRTVGSFLNNEGSGLYVLQSCCNHNCEPNASSTFPNNNFRLSMTALGPIGRGDEICISYLDECDLDRSRHSRDKILRENYLFSCRCHKCQSQDDDPNVTSEEEMDDE